MQHCPDYFQDFDPSGKSRNLYTNLLDIYLINPRLTKLLFPFFLFNFKEKVTKICDQDGNWFRHPASNRTWTNYTQCNVNTHEKVKVSNNYKFRFNLHYFKS